MSLCIAAAGTLVTLAVSTFTLSWTHSVEKVEWWEQWQVTPAGLQVVKARVKGSGAGMEPPDGAVLVDGGWEYEPKIAPLERLVLAASGAGVSGWHLCAQGQCLELAKQKGTPVELWASPEGPCTPL